MAIRSRRIYGPAFLTNAVVTLYTVPAGRTLIIRQIRVVNTDSNARNASLLINGSGAANRVGQWDAIAARASVVENGWWALDPGDTLRGLASVNSLVTISVFGALLLGEPS